MKCLFCLALLALCTAVTPARAVLPEGSEEPPRAASQWTAIGLPDEPLAPTAPAAPRVVSSSTVRGDSHRSAAATPRFGHEWYGYSTLLPDAAALSLLLAGFATEGTEWGGLHAAGLVTYAVGAPLMHVSQEQPVRGLASFGLRVALPVALYGVGYGLGSFDDSNSSCPEDEDCVDGGVLAGTLLFVYGVGAAMVVDSAALAWKRVPARPKDQPSFALTPIVDSKRTGVALSGTF